LAEHNSHRPGTAQARPGNDNARGRRDAATGPAFPPPFQRARQALAQEYRDGRFVNWAGSASAPSLYGMTVSVPDPRESTVPDDTRPFAATIDDVVTWHPSPAAAREAVEAEFVRREDAAWAARLAKNPFSDPLLRAALYRALRGR
jgi:hypothetical protein